MVAHWVLDPLGTGNEQHRAAGAPGVALWVPDPLRSLAKAHVHTPTAQFYFGHLYGTLYPEKCNKGGKK